MSRARERAEHAGHTYEDMMGDDCYDARMAEAMMSEVVRCPFCGNWTETRQIERPVDVCHHDVLPAP